MTKKNKEEIDLDKHEYDIAQFMNWFIRHYSTATIDGMFGYVNSMNEPISLEQILENYREQHKNN